ncbi:MAG: AmmeMemoRadiSam system protein A [Bacteroidota bacterium]
MVTFRQMLTEEEKRALLSIARASILRALKAGPAGSGGSPGQPAETGSRELTGNLAKPGGAFVTIKLGGLLRGCIGYIESSLPVGAVVAEVAEKAALEDPRFPPLTFAEAETMEVEVSVLSPLNPVADIEEIQVGVHGLVLELGKNRGLLLPQVAAEYGWDRRAFLEHTARKSGLPPNAWEDPRAKIYLFSAHVVREGYHE